MKRTIAVASTRPQATPATVASARERPPSRPQRRRPSGGAPGKRAFGEETEALVDLGHRRLGRRPRTVEEHGDDGGHDRGKDNRDGRGAIRCGGRRRRRRRRAGRWRGAGRRRPGCRGSRWGWRRGLRGGATRSSTKVSPKSQLDDEQRHREDGGDEEPEDVGRRAGDGLRRAFDDLGWRCGHRLSGEQRADCSGNAGWSRRASDGRVHARHRSNIAARQRQIGRRAGFAIDAHCHNSLSSASTDANRRLRPWVPDGRPAHRRRGPPPPSTPPASPHVRRA